MDKHRLGLRSPGCQCRDGFAQLPHMVSQAGLVSNNWNLSCILTVASSKVTQMGIAFIIHREKWSAVLCPQWAPDLRDIAHVPNNGLRLPHPVSAPFETGCNKPLAGACLPTPPIRPLHRMSQLHQPSSCHSVSHSCPHLGGKVRVLAELARTDSPWQVEKVVGVGGYRQAPGFFAVFGFRFH